MKKLIASLSMVASICAFGAIDDTTICFSTKGPDTYADGTTVLDGERYVLVRSLDTEKGFAGFNADGTLVSDKDEVLMIVSAAKAGRCPLYAYALPASKFKEGGVISLWMLDTRIITAATETTPASVKFAAIDQEKKTVAKVAEAKQAAEAQVSVSGAQAFNGATTAQGAGFLPADSKASVKKVEVKDGLVYITVENTSGFLTYDVKAGTTPDNLTSGAAQSPVKGAGEITIVTEQKGNTGFFQLETK